MIDVGFVPFSSLNSMLTSIAENEYMNDKDMTKEKTKKNPEQIKVETVYNGHQVVLNVTEGTVSADENSLWYKNFYTKMNTLLSPMIQDLFYQYKEYFEEQIKEMITESLGGAS